MFKKTIIKQHLIEQRQKHSLFAMLRHIKREGGRPVASIFEWLYLKIIKNRGLWFKEYIWYRLYDPNMSKKEKEAFIGGPVGYWHDMFEAIRPDYQITDNKALMHEILEYFKIRSPKLYGVIASEYKRGAAHLFIKNHKELKEFLLERKDKKIFMKPNFGYQSLGVMLINGRSDTEIFLENHPPISFKKFIKTYVKEDSFVLQEFIENHQALKKFTKYTCTIRTYNILREGRVISPFMLIKIPVGENIADNFWREENIVAAIDQKTGVIIRAIQRDGLSLKSIAKHPDTGEDLIGFQVPFWDDVLKMNTDVSVIYKELQYQAFDIAITDEGPVMIEVNSSGDVSLVQIAFGEGFLTDEVLEFIGINGSDDGDVTPELSKKIEVPK